MMSEAVEHVADIYDFQPCAADGCTAIVKQADSGLFCSNHGGPILNCVNCGEGKRWWLTTTGICPYHYICRNCGKDPLVKQ